jgi:hypothetical protein
MSRGGPDFDELVAAEELDPRERERLERVHDLLVQAGPPPELPPSLREPPAPAGTWHAFPQRRRGALILLAAAVSAAAFGAGYLVGGRHHGTGFSSQAAIPMHGTSASPRAQASLLIAKRDASGNWPMLLSVSGLPQLPAGGYYELYLTKHGRPAAACGVFRVHGGTTTVRLNAPYSLKSFDGWVVTRHVPSTPDRAHERILLTT